VNELHLFAGAGGGILGGKLLGHTCVCAVEWDKHARQCLLARQRDGCLPRFPIWDDVQTFDGKPWRGRVDVLCGGFPCQDISAAGKGAGIDGARSGMWHHMARIVGEIRPRYVFVENSPMLTLRGLGRVLGDLAGMGYDTEWGVLGACDAGAPHKRERIWILANADETRRNSARPAPSIRDRQPPPIVLRVGGNATWWASDPAERPTESGLVRVVDGVADNVDRIERLGNGQVPAVAALAFQVLSARLDSALANDKADPADL
jgi:DNA (cytosine-5)-methyltransferase 1